MIYALLYMFLFHSKVSFSKRKRKEVKNEQARETHGERQKEIETKK